MPEQLSDHVLERHGLCSLPHGISNHKIEKMVIGTLPRRGGPSCIGPLMETAELSVIRIRYQWVIAQRDSTLVLHPNTSPLFPLSTLTFSLSLL
jgi:hypothetical protein